MNTTTAAPTWDTTRTGHTAYRNGRYATELTTNTVTCTNPDTLPGQVRDTIATYYEVDRLDWEVAGRGEFRPGRPRTHRFTCPDKARAFANARHAHLVSAGWTRIA